MFKCVEDNQEGCNKIRGYFDKLGYSEVFDWFYANNEGKDNPYHNNTHTFNVVELIKQYCDSIINCEDSTRVIYMIAALFHDFNHSGGKLIDSENIQNAIRGFNRCIVELGLNSPTKKGFIMIGYRMLIISLIMQTQYPYKKIRYKSIRILREADILSYEHKKWEKYVYQGLCKELNLDIDNYQENIDKMVQFHRELASIEIETPFFVELRNKHIDSFENALLRRKRMIRIKKEINNKTN